MEPMPATSSNRRFGKYTLVAKLAQGGMAEIFLARLGGAAGFEKLVCIKRILPQFLEDPQFVAMFLDEAKIAARISHPNVCQVYELGELDGQFYIAMEYLEGVPLASFRRPELYPMPPDPRLVAGFIVQATEGLHHAHQLKGTDGAPLEVVHRDISPQNLFVTADGIVKVLDFGIAKIQDASHKTTTGAVKGTYAYMAPEQLRSEKIDRRADVFAMGAVTWELLARRHLFRRETDFLMFEAIMREPIPDVCTFRPDIPPDLGDVIAKALSRNPEKRWPSARAFGEALAQAALPLGGPLAASAIAEEVAHAFSDKLAEQHTLIRLAREGSELDLESASSSPSLGLGVELGSTPTSALKRRSQALAIPEAPPSAAMSIVSPRISGVQAIQRISTVQPVAVPVAPAKSRLGLVIFLLLFAAAGGAGAVYYFFVYKHEAAPPVATQGPMVAMTVTDAAPAAIPSDAPTVPAAVPVDAGVADAEPVDAASTAGTSGALDAGVSGPPQHPKHPVVKTLTPTGPPGTISIDSTPVYAVIFIDGKRYGETPLSNLKLSPGRHAVRAVSPSGATRNITVTIESGKKAPGRRIEW